MRTTPTKLLALSVITAVTSIAPPSAYAGILDRERLRRQQAVAQSHDLLMQGREAQTAGNIKRAVDLYRQALDSLPYGPATAQRRNEYAAHLSDASEGLAQTYRREGRYKEARDLLNEVVVADPGNQSAKQQLEYLDDPIRTNPALTAEHTKDIDKVRRLLYMGEGHYNLGRYDAAAKEFKNVLRVDPYNKAARRWLERVHAIKSDYYRSAYDETRAKLLMEVDQAWETAVPPEVVTFDGQGIEMDTNEGSALISEKLKSIIIPSLDLADGTSVQEAVDFLRMRSQELDNTTLDPDRKGVNFVVREGKVSGDAAALDGGGLGEEGSLAPEVETGTKKIKEVRLKNVPLAYALQKICDQASLRYKVDDYAVTLLPLNSGDGDDIVTRTWTVPPTFKSDLESGGSGGDGGAAADPFGGGADESASLSPTKSIEELLRDQGVPFPPGASASYRASTSKLVVLNTTNNLDIIDAIVEAGKSGTPKQIRIRTKFVEVSQENTDELGFDWVVSPFGAVGSTFLGGGTQGSANPNRSASDFTSVGGFTPLSGNGIVTAGNRTGDGAITRNSIDFLLNNPQRTAQVDTAAPGILSLTGIFSEGSVQMIMRGLAQKKGVDIMTAPSITARSGQTATIEVIREFIYPTEYEPPELPSNVGSSGSIAGGTTTSSFPVTPATPTAFETENTGVTLEIEPTLGANDYVIDLRFAPKIVEFEGFINYGSPITSPLVDALGNVSTATITENRIEMPVFNKRKVVTALTIYDGHTVAVGGLMREDVQNVEDKIPVLGDIPFIGRLFQSKSENHIKSNLIIFVSARIIDATGRPIRDSETGASLATPSIDDFGSTSTIGVSADGGPGFLPVMGGSFK